MAGLMCTGNFVNPITDICWDCLFPITIGNIPVIAGEEPDTINPGSPICVCKDEGPIPKIGISLGYWEPFALEDVTRSPMCMVNIGGIQLPLAGVNISDMGGAGHSVERAETPDSFYWVHWYKYPITFFLNIITDTACSDSGDFDIGYITELDPTWNDDTLAFVLNPEAILFGNPITQTSCVADSIASTKSTALDPLFWCMGANGSPYPLTGTVPSTSSNVTAVTLEGERLNYKLHREGLLWDSLGTNIGVCQAIPMPILPKSRYRYEMVNTIPDALFCHPYGHLTTFWESGHDTPISHGNYGYLVWRKRNCCFL